MTSTFAFYLPTVPTAHNPLMMHFLDQLMENCKLCCNSTKPIIEKTFKKDEFPGLVKLLLELIGTKTMLILVKGLKHVA